MPEENTPKPEQEKPQKRRKKSLQDKLTEAVKDLYYISETDAPFEPFTWKPETGAEAFSEVKADDVLRLSENAPETPVREQSLADFFRFPATEQDWHTDEDKETVKRYQKLKELLESNLKNPKVFKIGEVEIKVYIVGVDEEGNLTGVKTEAVET